MEFLEIVGIAELKVDANMDTVNSVIQQLANTEFENDGFIEVGLDDNLIAINAQGVIQSSYSIRALLRMLQGELSEGSWVCISRERWEVTIALRNNILVPELQLQPKEEVIFTQ